jgi:hypothetical protein
LVPVMTTSFSKFKSRESLDSFSWEKKPWKLKTSNIENKYLMKIFWQIYYI